MNAKANGRKDKQALAWKEWQVRKRLQQTSVRRLSEPEAQKATLAKTPRTDEVRPIALRVGIVRELVKYESKLHKQCESALTKGEEESDGEESTDLQGRPRIGSESDTDEREQTLSAGTRQSDLFTAGHSWPLFAQEHFWP